jgi:hypothetical protein
VFTLSADPKETVHLQALDGAKDRLHLFEASLLEEGSFDAAIGGGECVCVFHTASPCYFDAKDPKVTIMITLCKITDNNCLFLMHVYRLLFSAAKIVLLYNV